MTLTDEEIRVKVAELMGWRLFPYVVINGIRKDIPTWIDPRMAPICTPDKPHAGCYAGKMPPNWLIDPAAALQLCDRMHSEGWSVQLIKGNGEWACSAIKEKRWEFIRDPCLPRAVTLCFLAAHSNEN